MIQEVHFRNYSLNYAIIIIIIYSISNSIGKVISTVGNKSLRVILESTFANPDPF